MYWSSDESDDEDATDSDHGSGDRDGARIPSLLEDRTRYERIESETEIWEEEDEFDDDCDIDSDENVDDEELRFPEVHRAELRFIERQRRARLESSKEEDRCKHGRFSVAFSGGGVRAAAFQAGVLWQLAEHGLLQDVDYLAAVSGGSYIAAAFASHVADAGPELTSGQSSSAQNAAYLKLVARTICRMQGNTPYLCRDLGKRPWTFPKDGSSFLPRAFDIPILFFACIFNFSISPVCYFLQIVAPLIEVIEYGFGGIMREEFCSERADTPFAVEFHWPGLVSIGTSVEGVFLVTLCVIFVLWVLRGLLKSKSRKSRSSLYVRLFMRSCSSALTRFVLLFLVMCLITVLSTNLQVWGHESRESNSPTQTPSYVCLCHRYIHGEDSSGQRVTQHTCADRTYTRGRTWYDFLPHLENCSDSESRAMHRRFARAGRFQQCGGAEWEGPTRCKHGLACVVHDAFYSECEDRVLLDGYLSLPNFFEYPVQTILLIIFPAALGVSVILIPFSPKLYRFVLTVLGPFVVVLVTCTLVQLRIFGPITGETILGIRRYDHWAASILLVLAMSTMPFQHILRASMHRFYRRSLQRAFFSGGNDKTWNDVAGSPYIPFLLITATVNDYMRPGDKVPLSDITLSTLHTGGLKTGYSRTPTIRSFVRSVALSGAAIDAFILGKNDHIRLRFWKELLALSMGDFVTFDRFGRDNQWQWRCAWARRCCGERAGRVVARAPHFWLRLPSLLVCEIVYGLLLLGVWMPGHNCELKRHSMGAAFAIGLCFITLSYFAFLPCLDVVLHSLLIRGVHQLTKFYHRSETAPSLLYVTDGGLLDNTGVLQLMRRRCKNILHVYAGNDPKHTFKWLTKLRDAAAVERLGALYDAADPRRDLRETFEIYIADRSISYIHLGIKYGWSGRGERTGNLFIVMNRVTSSSEDLPVQLLTETEIVSSVFRSATSSASLQSDTSELDDMKQTDLGGCCCDCCHRNGCNFGRKFPRPNNANQCITPLFFSSLCRLGHHISAEAVEAIATVSRTRQVTSSDASEA